MLWRVINGTKSARDRARLIEVIRHARSHPLANENMAKAIESLVEDL